MIYKSIIICFFIILYCFADIAPLGSESGFLIISNQNIRLVSQKIDIYPNRIDADVKGIFKLVSDSLINNFTVYFPDSVDRDNRYNKLNNKTTFLPNRKIFDSKPIKNFKAIINNEKIIITDTNIVDTIKIPVNSNFADTQYNVINWHCFKFPVKNISPDTTTIQIKYKSEWAGRHRLDYYLGSGKKWSSTIGKGIITFHFGPLIPKSLLTDYSKVTGIKSELMENELRYSFTNFEPSSDCLLSLSIFKFWSDTTAIIPGDKDLITVGIYEICYEEDFKNFIKNFSADDKQHLLNDILARNGYPFKNKKLLNKYSSFNWYKKNSGFNLKNLSGREKVSIDVLLKDGCKINL